MMLCYKNHYCSSSNTMLHCTRIFHYSYMKSHHRSWIHRWRSSKMVCNTNSMRNHILDKMSCSSNLMSWTYMDHRNMKMRCSISSYSLYKGQLSHLNNYCRMRACSRSCSLHQRLHLDCSSMKHSNCCT